MGVGGGVGVGLAGVEVGVDTTTGVDVGLGVEVGMGAEVGVATMMGVAVGEGVGVDIGIAVSVGLGLPPQEISSSKEKQTPARPTQRVMVIRTLGVHLWLW